MPIFISAKSSIEGSGSCSEGMSALRKARKAFVAFGVNPALERARFWRNLGAIWVSPPGPHSTFKFTAAIVPLPVPDIAPKFVRTLP